jgi:heat shock protein HslJ
MRFPGAQSFGTAATSPRVEWRIAAMRHRLQSRLSRPTPHVRRTVVLIALFIASAVACNGKSTLVAVAPSASQSQPPALDGTSWTVISLNGVEVPADAHIELQFTRGRLTGNSGCNSFNSDYSQQAATLRIGELAATRTHCPDPVGTREQALFAGLPATVTLTSNNDRIELLDAMGVVRIIATRKIG